MKTFWDCMSEDSDYCKNEKMDFVDGKRIALASQREFYIDNIEGGYVIDKKDGNMTVTPKNGSPFNITFKDFLSKKWPTDEIG